ncbi:MAG: glycosyltransferase family 4 protein [Acidiferrobacteraceae bacterium]
MFVVSSLCVGGSEKKTVAMANRLTSRGWEIHLGVLGEPQDLLPTVAAGVNTLLLARRRRVDRQTVGRLRAYLAKQRIARLWSVNQYPMLYARLAAQGLPFSVRQVVGINTTDFYSSYERLQMLLYAPMLRRMATVVFGSTTQQEAWIGRYRLPAARTTVIHNGVDLQHFAAPVAARARTQADTGLILGMVAQFRPEKGHGILLDAIARLRREGVPVRLLLVGDGPELSAIRERARRLELNGAVEFAGRTKDVRPYLASMDAFVLPSLAVETFSNAALEAMASGLPVILSNIGGASEMIVDGECGFLCPPGDVTALTLAIRRLMDPAMRRVFGTAAQARVAAQFSVDAMVQRYEEVLRC